MWSSYSRLIGGWKLCAASVTLFSGFSIFSGFREGEVLSRAISRHGNMDAYMDAYMDVLFEPCHAMMRTCDVLGAQVTGAERRCVYEAHTRAAHTCARHICT
jgi:hypothetical protein